MNKLKTPKEKYVRQLKRLQNTLDKLEIEHAHPSLLTYHAGYNMGLIVGMITYLELIIDDFEDGVIS